MYSETRERVRYAETDRMGIVHHRIYPVWYEIARTDLIKKIGITYSQMEEEGIMTPLVELTSRYIKPVTYEDEIIIKAKVEKLTPARIIFAYEVYHKGELINTGTTMHAWTGSNLKPINLKKVQPELYKKIEEIME